MGVRFLIVGRLRRMFAPLIAIVVLATSLAGTPASGSGVVTTSVATISGTVRNASQQPVANATVRIFNTGTTGVLTELTGTTTNAQGQYTVGVDKLQCSYVIVVEPSAGSLLADGYQYVPLENLSATNVNLTLGVANVTGSVFQAKLSSAPAANATVSAKDSANPYYSNTTTVWVRADGTYRMHLSVGDYELTADPDHANSRTESPSLPTTIKIVDSATRLTEQNLRLREPTLYGRLVIEGTSTAIPQAYVRFYDKAQDNKEVAGSWTDGDGKFHVAVANGNYDVYSYSSSLSTYDVLSEWTQAFEQNATSKPSAPGSRLTFEVKKPNFRGKVTAPGSTTPLKGAKLSVETLDGSYQTLYGGIDADGWFGYYLPPSEQSGQTRDYVAVAVSSYADRSKYGSKSEFVSISTSGVVERTIQLSTPFRPGHLVEQLELKDTTPCGLADATYHEERIIALSDDASTALVDACLDNYATVHSYRVIDTTSGTTLREFNGTEEIPASANPPEEMVTMSRDGAVVAWATRGSTTYDLSVANVTGITAQSATVVKPPYPHTDFQPALSADGSQIAFFTSKTGESVVRVCSVANLLEGECGSSAPSVSTNGIASGLRVGSKNGEISTVSFLVQPDPQNEAREVVVLTKIGGDWEETLRVPSAPVAPMLSADGSRFVWLPPLQQSIFVSDASPSGWSSAVEHTPIDVRRLTFQKKLTSPALSGDGKRVFFITSVNDLAFSGTATSSPDRYTLPQVWSFDVEDEEASVASIDITDRLPFGGFAGAFDSADLVVSGDGSSFGYSSGVEVNIPGNPYPLSRQRLIFGVSAGSVVYEFPDDASIESVRGSQLVKLSWTAATGNKVTYSVTRSVGGGPAVLVTPQPISSTEILADGLSPATTYLFTVNALYQDGRVADSLSQSITTTAVRSRILNATTSDGGRVSFTWDAEPLGTGCKVEMTKSGSGSVVEATGTSSTAATSGLAAGTTWTALAVCTVNQARQEVTDSVTVKIPNLSITQASWTVPLSGRFARRGGTLQVTVRGEANRAGSAVVSRTSVDGESDDVSVTLSEGPAGVYTGTLALDGLARIDSVSGRISDGSGTDATRVSDQPGLSVEAVAKVSVSADARQGWRVAISSADGSVVRSETLASNGAQTVTFSGLKLTEAMTARLFTNTNKEIDASEPTTIRSGEEKTLDLIAQKLVRVKFIATAGDEPVQNATIEATFGAQPWFGVTDSQGVASVSDVFVGSELRASVKTSDPLALTVSPVANRTVSEGDDGVMEVPIVVSEATSTSLSGVIRSSGSGNPPLSNVEVRLRQVRGDVSRTERVTTDANGRYEFSRVVSGLAAEVEAYASDGARGKTTVDAPNGQTNVDFTLDSPFVYRVPLHLYLGPDAAAPVSLDWRTAAHVGFSVKVGERTVSYAQLMQLGPSDKGGILAVRGNAGETVEACFDGYETGFGVGCASVDLPSPTATVSIIEVRLGRAFSVQVDVVGQNDVPFEGSVSIKLTRSDGTSQAVWSGSASGPKFSVPVKSAGTYRLDLTGWEYGPNVTPTASTTFTIEEGSPSEVILPAPLELSRSARFASSDNVILADRNSVAPKGFVEFRARWVNAAGRIANAVAKIGIPEGTTLNTRSVVIGTTQIPSGSITLEGSGASRVARVTLGELASFGSGTMRWRLDVDTASKAVTGSLEIGSGSSFDSLPSAIVPVVGVTLVAPTRPTTPGFAVRGRAPAGSSVVVNFDGLTLARATASGTGSWTADVVLPARPNGTVFTLTARATSGSDTHVSDPVRVAYDSTSVKMTDVCIRQVDALRSDGRRYCFDPAVGVAGFPFIFVPSQTLQVEVFTSDPSRVDRITVAIAGSKSVAVKRSVIAPTSGAAPPGTKRDGFVAEFNGVMVKGKISVSMTARKPVPVIPPRPTEGELAQHVPSRFLAYEPSELSDVVNTDSEISFTQTFDKPSTTVSGDASIQMSLKGSDELPTTAEVAEMSRTGSLVWGLDLGDPVDTTLPDGSKQRVRNITFNMRTSDIPSGTVASNGVRTLGLLSKVVKGAVKLIEKLEDANDAKSTIDDVAEAFDGGEKYDKIGNLLANISPCVKPNVSGPLIERGQSLLKRAAAADGINSFVAIASVIAVPAGPLGPIAVWAAGEAISSGAEALLEAATAKLSLDVARANLVAAKDPDCRKKPKPDPEPEAPPLPDPDSTDDPGVPIAWPTWIYDPSGYAYEGVESNRVSGVTATLLRAPDVGEDEDCPEVAIWSVVDMTPFEQVNPLVTDEEGRYGWDVPEGCWKVQWTKEGYQTKYSKALKVLPPHLDVHVSMVATTAPTVLSATLGNDGKVTVAFSRLMTALQTIESITLKDADGNEVNLAANAVSASSTTLGRSLAKSFLLVPATALSPGKSYTVSVSTTAVDYADTPLASTSNLTFDVPNIVTPTPTPPSGGTPSNEPPSGGGAGTPSGGQPSAPTPPTTVAPTVSNVFRVNKTASRTSLLKIAKVTAPAGSRVALSIATSSKKICRVSGTSVKMLAAGTCRVTVTVTPKKGKSTKKTATLKVTK